MKRCKSLCMLIILIMLVSTAACAETIVSYGGTLMYETGYENFLTNHPGVNYVWSSQVFSSMPKFTNALLTNSYTCDMFTWGTDQVDWSVIMKKGYCYDLSQSQVLLDAVQRMHPRIAEQAIRDGKLYAIPTSLSFEFLRIVENVWKEAGYTMADVPKSFPAFLDFLDIWCDRLEADAVAGICVFGGWDASSYSNATYIEWLTNLLVNEWIMQTQHAGKQLDFNDTYLLSLLQRCCEVGHRLFELEPKGEAHALFELSARNVWPVSSDHVVFLRADETQPKLIKASLSMWAIYTDASNPSLCIDLLEEVVTDVDVSDQADELLLYIDALPKVNPEYESNVNLWQRKIDDIELQLQNEEISAQKRLELSDLRSTYISILEKQEGIKWIMSADQLADYKKYAEGLFFPAPSVFTESSIGYDLLENLCRQFATGTISEDHFLDELNRIALMLSYEQ